RIESGELKLIARGGDESYQHFEDAPTLQEAGYGDVVPSTDISIPLLGPPAVPAETAGIIGSTRESGLARAEALEGIGQELVAPQFIDAEQVTQDYAELARAIDDLQ